MNDRLLFFGLLLLSLVGCALASGSRYEIGGDSMAPTYPDETVVAVEKLADYEPQRGDLVLFPHPANPELVLLKRVIGLPGEHVEVRDGQLFVDERPLDEPYLFDTPSYTLDVTVEVDTVLLLGDNRNNSYDSHVFGAISMELVQGRVTAVCTTTPCVPIEAPVYDQ